jgi:hypothetical protein
LRSYTLFEFFFSVLVEFFKATVFLAFPFLANLIGYGAYHQCLVLLASRLIISAYTDDIAS